MINDILNAVNAQDFFGTNKKRAGICYRRYAKTVHPDVNSDPQATEAFQRLNAMWEEYNTSPAESKKNNKNSSKTIVIIGGREYALNLDTQTDTFFTRYLADETTQVLVTSTVEDNDLTQNHIEKLSLIANKVDEKYHAFYPSVMETFENTDGNLGVMQKIHKGFVPFTEILKTYPQGIEGRDMGWIFKRVFMIAGLIHEQGIVHAGISLDSLYINPEEHGIILNDWQYSTNLGTPLTAVPFTEHYPQEFLNKKPVTPDLDIQLIAQTALKLSNEDEPRMVRFFEMAQKSLNKNGEFWFNEFDWLLQSLYGKPRFHPFTLK